LQKKQQVRGVVADRDGQGIPGASIFIKGTSISVRSDVDGIFSLLADDGVTLVVSFLGYKTEEVKASAGKHLQMILQDDYQEIEEVVVTGYGNVLKKDMTGAISVFSMKAANEQSGISPLSALQGRIAGLQMTQSSGAPGSAPTILLRGANSVSGNNSPLIVVDGVPMDNEYMNPGTTTSAHSQYIDTPPSDMLSTINPNDIESVQVMKDASSTPLYGSRGANGVILITTRQGQKGKARVNFSSRFDAVFCQLDILLSLVSHSRTVWTARNCCPFCWERRRKAARRWSLKPRERWHTVRKTG
jgi:iron complex outermembrane receptor protein